MDSIVLRVPPIREQRAIAEVLGALDDKIAANSTIISTGEAVLRAEFQFLRIDSEPEEGSSLRADELFEFNPRRVAPSDPEPPYVDMQRLRTDSFLVSDWTSRPTSGGVRFTLGDTVMARITPCLENGKVGYIDFLKDGEVGIGSTEYIVVRSRTDRSIPLEASYFLATSSRFRAHAVINMSGTSGRQRVAARELASFALRRPDAEILAHFGARASAVFAAGRAMTDENHRLAATRDALLPALMSGKLRVRDAERTVEQLV